MTVTELTDLKTTINWLLENGEFKDKETSYNIAMNSVDMLEKQLSIPLVVHSKITALVIYWKWQESGHVMLDDTKNKTTEIVEVEKLTDINEMFTNLIDVKILK